MTPIRYRYCHFPPLIVRHAVRLYARFTLSFRDVEALSAQRGMDVSYETIRRWVVRFGPGFTRRLRTPWFLRHALRHLDEMFVSINGTPGTCGGPSTRTGTC